MTTQRYAVIPVAVEAFLIAITTLAISLRIVSRKLSKATLWWDDWLSIAAYPFAMAISISFLVAGFKGLGSHGGDPGFYLRSFYFGILWYYTGTALIKLSVLCFYYRIFSLSRYVTRTLWGIGIFVCLWWLAFMLASVFGCLPVQWLWDFNIVPKCIDMFAHCVANECINVTLDLIILILPLRPLWKLQMERKQKLALAVVFILGYLNPILSILRLVMTVKMDPTPGDITYNAVAPALCTSADVCVAVVSASIPSLTHLFRRLSKATATKSTFTRTGSPSEKSHSYTSSNSSFQKPTNNHKFGNTSHYGCYTTSVTESSCDALTPDLEGHIHVVREVKITVHDAN